MVYQNGYQSTMSWPDEVGIISLELYIPNYYVDQAELELFDGGDKFKGKYTVGLGQKQMGFVGDNEDVNSLCLTAVSRLMKRQGNFLLFRPTLVGGGTIYSKGFLFSQF